MFWVQGQVPGWVLEGRRPSIWATCDNPGFGQGGPFRDMRANCASHHIRMRPRQERDSAQSPGRTEL